MKTYGPEFLPRPSLTDAEWAYLQSRFADFLTFAHASDATSADAVDQQASTSETEDTMTYISGFDVSLPDGVHDRLVVYRYHSAQDTLAIYGLDLTSRQVSAYLQMDDINVQEAVDVGNMGFVDMEQFEVADELELEDLRRLIQELRGSES